MPPPCSPKYHADLVRERNLLSNLSRCLLETMRSASFLPSNPNSPAPAGSSPDILIDLANARNGHDGSLRNSDDGIMAAVSIALLGSFATENRGRGDSARLDAEIDKLLRYYEKSTHLLNQNSLIEKTAALVPPTLDPAHTVLSHRRYGVCVSDLKCVLNVDGMARHFASIPLEGSLEKGDIDHLRTVRPKDEQVDLSGKFCDCALEDWIKTLSLAQNMDGQMWRPWVKGHVDSEPRGWVGAFNTSISLSSLFERLLNWDDDDDSPIKAAKDEVRLLSCVELTYYTLTVGLHNWQRSEMLSYLPTPPPDDLPHPKVKKYAAAPASLPFPTVAINCGGLEGRGPLAMAAIPLPQIAVWSFHLPLHRFVAACIRELVRRQDRPEDGGACSRKKGGLQELLQMFAEGNTDVSRLHQHALLFRGLMEFPVIVVS